MTQRKPKRARVTHADIQRQFPNYPKPAQRKTFYAALGSAISTWQIVELNLYEIYRATTGANRPGAEAAGFYAIEGFRAQLKLTDAAVRFVALDHPELIDGWTNLNNQARKKSKWRNAMAHSAVWFEVNEPRPDRRIWIGPNLGDPRQKIRKLSDQDAEPLTLPRVRAYEKDFILLAKRLREFARRIPPPPAPRSEHDTRQSDRGMGLDSPRRS